MNNNSAVKYQKVTAVTEADICDQKMITNNDNIFSKCNMHYLLLYRLFDWLTGYIRKIKLQAAETLLFCCLSTWKGLATAQTAFSPLFCPFSLLSPSPHSYFCEFDAVWGE